MFPYTEKYTESESDIQNNDIVQNRPQMPKCFLNYGKRKRKPSNVFKTKKTSKFLFCNIYKLHNSYLVICFSFFCKFGICGFFVHFLRQSARRHIRHLTIPNAGNLIKTMVPAIKTWVLAEKTFLLILVQAPQRDQQPRSICPRIQKTQPDIGNTGRICFFW